MARVPAYYPATPKTRLRSPLLHLHPEHHLLPELHPLPHHPFSHLLPELHPLPHHPFSHLLPELHPFSHLLPELHPFSHLLPELHPLPHPLHLLLLVFKINGGCASIMIIVWLISIWRGIHSRRRLWNRRGNIFIW